MIGDARGFLSPSPKSRSRHSQVSNVSSNLYCIKFVTSKQLDTRCVKGEKWNSKHCSSTYSSTRSLYQTEREGPCLLRIAGRSQQTKNQKYI